MPMMFLLKIIVGNKKGKNHPLNVKYVSKQQCYYSRYKKNSHILKITNHSGILRPLRSFHFDVIVLLIVWRVVSVYNLLGRHAAVCKSPRWTAGGEISCFTLWCSECLCVCLAVSRDIWLCVRWNMCLTGLLWVLRCIRLCLRGRVSKRKALCVAARWKPIYARRAQSWHFKCLNIS